MKCADFIKGSLEKAADIALKYFDHIEGVAKAGDNNQVLTIADIEIGRLLVSECRRQYPEANCIDEESGMPMACHIMTS